MQSTAVLVAHALREQNVELMMTRPTFSDAMSVMNCRNISKVSIPCLEGLSHERSGFPDTIAVEDMECGEREPTLTELFRIASVLREPAP
jgi:hypothetical protein